jgi:hypothetical protein
MMMEAARTSETSVDNYFTRQYIPQDNSEPHTRRRENLKSHISYKITKYVILIQEVLVIDRRGVILSQYRVRLLYLPNKTVFVCMSFPFDVLQYFHTPNIILTL